MTTNGPPPDPPVESVAAEVTGAAFQARDNPMFCFADPTERPPVGLVVVFPGLAGEQITATVMKGQLHVESKKLIGVIDWCGVRKRWVITTLVDKPVIDKVNFA